MSSAKCHYCGDVVPCGEIETTYEVNETEIDVWEQKYSPSNGYRTEQVENRMKREPVPKPWCGQCENDNSDST